MMDLTEERVLTTHLWFSGCLGVFLLLEIICERTYGIDGIKVRVDFVK
jgi:hypothetical protein